MSQVRNQPMGMFATFATHLFAEANQRACNQRWMLSVGKNLHFELVHYCMHYRENPFHFSAQALLITRTRSQLFFVVSCFTMIFLAVYRTDMIRRMLKWIQFADKLYQNGIYQGKTDILSSVSDGFKLMQRQKDSPSAKFDKRIGSETCSF